MKANKWTLAAALLLATSCGQQKEQSAPEAEQPEVTTGTIVLADSTSTLTWIQDNPGHKLMERSLFPEASDSLIAALGLQDGIPASIGTFLLHCDGDWILFDTGLGADKGGLLLSGLRSLGLAPDSIDEIYLTHFHGDHIGGMLQGGRRVFPNARVFACSQEYIAWMMEIPSDQSVQQHGVLDAYRDQTKLFGWGDTLTHGIVAIDAKGHTPGHTAFLKENVLVVGDLMHGAALQLEHPEISGNYDMDKAQAAQTRVRILDLVRQNGYTMVGMHLPELSFIHLEQ